MSYFQKLLYGEASFIGTIALLIVLVLVISLCSDFVDTLKNNKSNGFDTPSYNLKYAVLTGLAVISNLLFVTIFTLFFMGIIF